MIEQETIEIRERVIVSARVEPSHESLLTLVDLESGKSARKVLDEVYSSWF